MARYKYLGEVEAEVPDLAGRVTVREHSGPIQPGEVFETDFDLSASAAFDLIPGSGKSAPPPPPAEEAE